MRDIGKGGKKPIEEVNGECPRKAKLEQIRPDVTEHKKLEELVERSKKEWENTFNAMSDWICVVDIEGRILHANKAAERFTGVTVDKVVGQSACKLVHGTEKHIVGCPLLKMLRTKQRESAEIQVPNTDKWLIVTVDPVKNEKGELAGAVHVIRDITERKRAEESLQESELRYRSLFENMLNGFAYCKIILDENNKPIDFVYLDVNDSFERLTGLKKENVIGKKATEAIPGIKDLQPDLFDIYGRTALTGEPAKFDIFFAPLEIWLSISVYSSQKGYFIAVFDNITERKRAEEALRESQERLAAAVDAAKLGMWDWNMVTGKIVWSGYQEKLFGFSEGEFDGRYETFEKRVHPDDIKGLGETINRSLKERTGYFHEHRVVWPDGTIRWIAGRGRFLYDEKGEAIRMLGAVVDITERKKADIALGEQKEILQTILDNIPVTIAFLDPRGKHQWVNQAWQKTLGWSLAEAQSRDVLKEIYPEPEYYRYVVNFIETAKSKWGDFRTKRRDGTILDTIWTNIPLSDGSNIGIGLDITERKRAEEALRESQEVFTSFMDQLPITAFMKDENGKVQYVNPYMTEEFGADKWINQTAAEYFPPEIAEGVLAHDSRALSEGPSSREEWVPDKNGRMRCMQTYKFPIHREGKPPLIGGVAIDITKRKRAEEKLIDYQAQLKSLASQLTLAEERERRRVAMELHDRISQTLAICKLELDALRASASHKGFPQVLDEVSDSLGKVIADTRSLTFDLSFPLLYELGFEAAVAAWLTEQIEKKYGIATEFKEDKEHKPLDDDVRVLLFRDVRELLINVVKHAQANKVKVSIHRIDNRISVSIEDDGVGFDPQKVIATAVKTGGFGLFSIRERLEELGGHFEIESEPGKGTKVTLIAPLKQSDIKHKQG